MPSSVRAKLDGVRIVHVVYDEILHSVVDSQVIEPIAALAERGIPVALIVFVTPRVLISLKLRRAHRERLARLRRRLPGVPIRFMVHTPRHRAAFIQTRRLRKMMRASGKEPQPTIFHCRGLFAAGVAARVKRKLPRCALIYDQRGHIVAEHELVRRKGKRSPKGAPLSRAARKLQRAETRIIAEADRIITVSSALAAHDVESHAAIHSRIRVQGAYVDTGRFAVVDRIHRDEVRSELGLDPGAFVLVYSGSHAPWQLPDEVAALVARGLARDPGTRLLLLTRDAAPFLASCQRAGIPEEVIVVKEVAHDLVTRYLAAGDAGILLREPSPVNQVASPVKAPEYLACGLPLIVSAGIGDLSQRVEEAEAGAVVNALDANAYDAALERCQALIAAGRDELAARASRLAAQHHSLSAGVDALVVDYAALSAKL
jgi:glycosyltransferase involved in cell wall biosynthesis